MAYQRAVHVATRLLAARPRPTPIDSAVVYPPTGATIGSFSNCGPDAVEASVSAAKHAQRVWGQTSGASRAALLRRAANMLEDRREDAAALEALDTGRPLAETQAVDVATAIDCLHYMAGVAGTGIPGEHIPRPGGLPGFAYTRREPLGVCAGIGAWNYPLQSAAWKVAPALAGGNSIVFKPSEHTVLTTLLLADVLQKAGLPDGVFSVVLGSGETGEHLVTHPTVAKVSFTGHIDTGKRIYAAVAPTLKRLTLELGGKSPLIIFPDADLKEAVSGALMANFYSAGQVCSNGTRVFVHKDIYSDFLAEFVRRTELMRLGGLLAQRRQKRSSVVFLVEMFGGR